MVKNKKNSKQHDSPALQDFLGFKVLPVLVDDNCRHYIYMRKHESRNSFHQAADRTLFVVNLPVDATEASLQDLFTPYGTIVYVQFPGDPAYEPPVKPKTKAARMKLKQQQLEKEAADKAKWRHLLHTGASAHIVFQSEEEVDKVLDMPSDDIKRWKTGKSSDQPLGYKRYMMHYKKIRPDPSLLQQQVDTFMSKFKAEEYQREREEEERRNQMDEDGFTVVTRPKKKLVADTPEIVVKKPREFLDFYRFQVREKKQNELSELRRRFEEDKQKIAKQKEARRFKPY
ncbi:hypothetical protein O0I10_009034 [Lichtheimia ornata]|uniref:RRM domain-containing protein n=1 Tax=Lichtheimia ornata TaxID=688661 RepID=A0AAD7UXZ0_9FUNG|nr:uncharacterized protein O0I10_009034 [Lichtheimia ornata]KAJ8655345.1 hypothetical protein O0I10_009034 [Lichtheimia ornata]